MASHGSRAATSVRKSLRELAQASRSTETPSQPEATPPPLPATVGPPRRLALAWSDLAAATPPAPATSGAAKSPPAELRGITLRRYLRERGPLPPNAACTLLEQIAPAVDAGHAAGIVHGAICPDSIWIQWNGIARLYFPTHVSGSAAVPSSRPAGYISPEEARGEPAVFETDLWALGALLCDMVRGHVPEPVQTVVDSPRVPSYRAPVALPPSAAAVQHVVDRAVAASRALRYPSARALTEALRESLSRVHEEVETHSEPRRSLLAAAGRAANTAVRVRDAPNRRPRASGDD